MISETALIKYYSYYWVLKQIYIHGGNFLGLAVNLKNLMTYSILSMKIQYHSQKKWRFLHPEGARLWTWGRRERWRRRSFSRRGRSWANWGRWSPRIHCYPTHWNEKLNNEYGADSGHDNHEKNKEHIAEEIGNLLKQNFNENPVIWSTDLISIKFCYIQRFTYINGGREVCLCDNIAVLQGWKSLIEVLLDVLEFVRMLRSKVGSYDNLIFGFVWWIVDLIVCYKNKD